MKKLNAFVITLTLIGILSLAGEMRAAKPCLNVNGTGQTSAVSPTAFQGTAVVDFGGQIENAAVTVVMLGPPRVTEDGTLQAETSHTLAFNGGSLVTLDNAVLSPTSAPGIYNLNTRARIVGGSGDFDGAGGFLSVHGIIDLINGTSSWRFHGRVCD